VFDVSEENPVRITSVTVKVVAGKEVYIHETDGDFNVESDVRLLKWDDEESERIERQIIELLKELSVRHSLTTFTYAVE
jgi:hypothetical protein